MKKSYRLAGLLAATLCLTNPVSAEGVSKAAVSDSAQESAVAKALAKAMTPGEGQKRLQAMIGTFDVAIRTWVDPSKPPIESSATSVSTWVLGDRYVQMMLSGDTQGQPFSGIGYVAFDNVSKLYQATWMDNGSTGMTWYQGGFDASGKSATMKGSLPDPLSGKPSPVELRMHLGDDGGHLTELWGKGLGSKMFKMMELRYTRSK
ncbi:MAG: hypothetical protein AW10_02198 [Candidatus Accumulibacter appositus]|uniref:DUF1579 domain-containing protein n=1 Tax=Candidatus Accumulibacter appositus TaxID=1454003 RepID=A0A011QM17_9PROT|nr:DUF1579 family protein [Accumulibacter sp.]EXI79899.1 MAG: hypothetical protein AW10_02198 [Candidatus Accumulibacter appositus]HRF05461.1 DUF1579 family protein [Accumulibacter sp.]